MVIQILFCLTIGTMGIQLVDPEIVVPYIKSAAILLYAAEKWNMNINLQHSEMEL